MRLLMPTTDLEAARSWLRQVVAYCLSLMSAIIVAGEGVALIVWSGGSKTAKDA
jgi:hypothetical protein